MNTKHYLLNLLFIITALAVSQIAQGQSLPGWSYEPEENITGLLSMAEETLELFNESNLSTDYINIELLHAKDELKYGGNKQLVLELLNGIGRTREQALFLMDYISSLEVKLSDYGKQGIDIEEAKEKLTLAKNKLQRGLYDDAESIAKEADIMLDAKYSYKFSTEALIDAGTGKVAAFIKKSWEYLAFSLAGLIILSLALLRVSYAIRLRKKLMALKVEEKILLGLIKTTQEDYFNHKTISPPAYKIKIDIYRHRLAQVKQEMAALRKKFAKTGKKHAKMPHRPIP